MFSHRLPRKDSACSSVSCLPIGLSRFHLRFPGNLELGSDWHLKDFGSGGKCGRVPASSLGQLLMVRLVNKAGRHTCIQSSKWLNFY